MRRFLIGMLLSAAAVCLRAETPSITQQPVSLTVTNGGTAVFKVEASGTGPFTYQWQLNGTNLSSIITTVAGTGSAGPSGDGGPGTNATLTPAGMGFDNAGNLFIAELYSCSIRKLDHSGVITTAAGMGLGFSGDGGPAVTARLNTPTDVAVDGANNLFIADNANNRVRKVDANGIITTVAGGGTNNPGDGGPATSVYLYGPSSVAADGLGNLYIAEYFRNRVRKVDANGIITTVAGTGMIGYSGDGGPATEARFSSLGGIAVDDAGNLFISDSGNCRIRKVDTHGIVTTVAGNGIAGFSGDGGPATGAKVNAYGIALDGAGNLFIADLGNSRIRKVDADGIITTVAGSGTAGFSGDGGLATKANLQRPSRITSDRMGSLFISDSGNSRLRKVNNLTATSPTLMLGNSGPGNAGTYSVIVTSPYGSATSDVATLSVLMPPSIDSHPTNQSLFVGEAASFRVSASGSGSLSYFWLRNGDPIAGANDSSYSIRAVQLSDSGAQFSCLVSNLCGSITSKVATLSAVLPHTITQQKPIEIVTNGNTASLNVTVSGTGPFTYQWRFNETDLRPGIVTVAGSWTNGYSGDGGGATEAKLWWPMDVALDKSGNMFIVDNVNRRIRKVDATGTITTVAGTGFYGFSGDGGPAISARLIDPQAIAVDATGNLLIADTGNGRIRKIDTNGIITTVAGGGASLTSGPALNARLALPQDVALDAAGNLYICDYSNHRICVVDSDGILRTVAGTGTSGFAGDGGAAVYAKLRYPQNIALDAAGNLYISDLGNHRVRKVDVNGTITTVAGTGANEYSGDGGPATSAALSCPAGLVIDEVGNLLFADQYNNRVRMVDLNGIITTIAGNGTTNYSGDGGPATLAALCHPRNITLDYAGNLIIADTDHSRIRNVSVTTRPTLVLANVSSNNAGNYSVVVKSPYGSVTSPEAILTVSTPAGIASQPTNQYVSLGQTATFSVGAFGTEPLSYLWLRDGTPLSGGNGPSYSIHNAQGFDSGAQFTCVISNAYGSVTSSVVTLNLGTLPSFTQQPVSTIVSRGATASLSVAASGTGPFTYQWQRNGTNLVPIITTVAGNGMRGVSGDGIPATNAGLLSVAGVGVDRAGNLFIADTMYRRIRKVDANGIITTVAGSAAYSDLGDGGPATSAGLNSPDSVAWDRAGNLLIADSGNNRIRKVDANGIITTIAGNGISGYSGDGDAATNASLNFPGCMVLDSEGNLFIEDFNNRCIRKVDTNGIITTVAGRRENGSKGDGGFATNAFLSYSRGIAVDSVGTLFIAEYDNFCLRKVDTNGIISTVLGDPTIRYSGPMPNVGLRPNDVTLDWAGNLFIADSLNHSIYKLDASGMITAVAGNGTNGYSGDGGLATNAALNSPQRIAFDNEGNLLISDAGNYRVRKVSYLSATAPTLKLPKAGLSDLGDYSVIVSSPYGSITSSVVTLSLSTVLPPQEFTGTVTEQANVALQFKGGTPSYPYVLLTTTNLTPPVSWEAVGTNLTDGDGVWRMSVSATNADSPARFFRVLGQ